MASPLRTLYWNAYGLKRKEILLRAVLKEQDIDVALICETFLTPNIHLHTPGYHIYRLDHAPAAHTPMRGLAVMVRRKIVHQVLTPPDLASFQALGIELLIAGRPHRLYAIYRPPAQDLNLKDLHTVFDLDRETPTVLAGDWNAKHPAWNSTHSCPIGRKLLHDATTKGYDITGPGTPTYYPFRDNYMPNVLDIVVSRGLQQQPALEVHWDAMGSDHLPVLAFFHPGTNQLQPPSRKVTNWERFENRLQEATPTRPVTTPADVDSLATDLATCIGEALTDATTDTALGTSKPPMPHKLRKLLEKKRRTRRQWQVTRCPTLKGQFHALSNKIRSELYGKAAEEWDDRIESASKDTASAHKLCKQLTRTPDPIHPLLHADGNLRYRAEDRAEILANHLEQQFRPFDSHNTTHTSDIERKVSEYFATTTTTVTNPFFFSPGMVKKAVGKTKPGKAPGADGITNAALRHLPRTTIAAVTRLYNGILRTGHFPGAWKEGIIIMLPKPSKNTTKPESYRPITLLPTLSKIFEALLLRKMTPHLIPRDEQFGFRAEHSTTQQLARVLHVLTSARNKKEKAVAIFLDMEKAFDRVWHTGLLYKVTRTTTPPPIPHIIRSFLENRSFRVKVDSKLSSTRPIRAGVPQGSRLSPLLYSCFTNDIPASDDVTLALYADDAAYVATSLTHTHARAKIQRVLDTLPDWLHNWRMNANAQKTQAICMGSHVFNKPPPLVLLNETIQWNTKVKYLGLIIDQGLTMTAHVKQVANQTRAATFALRPILRSRLPLRIKLGVYKTYIRSRLTYAAPAWYALTNKKSRKSMQSQQAAALRLLTNAPRYVRNATISRDLRIESVDNFIVRLATSMFARADASLLEHIKDIAPWHARPPDRKAYPRDLLETTQRIPPVDPPRRII